MRSRWLPFLAVATLSVTACNSEATSSFDSDAQARVDAVTNCLPNLWPLAAGVLEIADAWQLDGDDNPVDPAGLTWSFTGSDITADLAVGGGPWRCASGGSLEWAPPSGSVGGHFLRRARGLRAFGTVMPLDS